MKEVNVTRKWHAGVSVALWFISLLIYAPFLVNWSLSGDEFYTYEDSTFSISKMLSFNSRPLYFIVCHYLLKWLPDWPVELTIRFPSMLATSLIAPCIYGMLRPERFRRVGLLAAMVAVFNPWLFQMSQFGRYYGFVLFFATLTTLAALRFVEERNWRWPVVTILSGLLAAASHPPAVLLVPASMLGWIIVGLWANWEVTIALLRKYGAWLVAACLFATGLGIYLLQDVLRQWAGSGQGDFGGHYDMKSIVMSLGVVGGLSSWSLALLPLLRTPTTWSKQDIFLGVLLASSTLPLFALVPFGGGVSSRYLLYCLPCMFLLAGQHWQLLHDLLPSKGYQLALGCVLFGCNVPLMLSVVEDGDHYDFRKMAAAIAATGIEQPVIYSSNHRLLDYYLDDRFQVMGKDEDDLGLFAVGLPKTLIERAIALATSQNRPLLLVSRQDRSLLSSEDQAWLYEKFAVLRTVEKARYDHRRHRLILYHYRPMKRCPDVGS